MGRNPRATANPVNIAIAVAGAILMAVGGLTAWWGIAVMALVAVFSALTELTAGEEFRSEIDALLGAFILTPFVVAGVYVGALVLDAWWGALVGGLVGSLLAVIPATLLSMAFDSKTD